MEKEKAEESRAPRAPRPKAPPSAAHLAAVAVLDRLRAGDGEKPPANLPLACVVKVTANEKVPLANERYAMVTVEGRDGRTWRLCVYRRMFRKGSRALFVREGAALPVDDRYRTKKTCTVVERVFRFGFGVNVRRLVPHVKRNIYRHNSGVLFPLADFPELADARSGDVCAVKLGVDDARDLHDKATAPGRPRSGTAPDGLAKAYLAAKRAVARPLSGAAK